MSKASDVRGRGRVGTASTSGKRASSNPSRAVTPRPAVFTKIDKILANEAGKVGFLVRRIEDDVEKVLTHLEARLRSSSEHSIQQWQTIQIALETTVKNIRKLVTDGRTKAQDTFNTFAEHYLSSGEDTPSVKLREIDTLIKDLQEDSRNTLPTLVAVHDALERAKADIIKFNNLWPQDGSAFSEELQPRVRSIQENIDALIRGKGAVRMKDRTGLGLADSLALLRSSLSNDEKQAMSAFALNARIEMQDCKTGSSQKDMMNMLDILLSVNKMICTDILGLRDQYNDYLRRNDMVTFDTLYQRTRELYSYLTRAIDEFRNSYANVESFCGPCGGQVNKDMGADLDTHHTSSTAKKQMSGAPKKVSLMTRIVRFFGGS